MGRTKGTAGRPVKVIFLGDDLPESGADDPPLDSFEVLAAWTKAAAAELVRTRVRKRTWAALRAASIGVALPLAGVGGSPMATEERSGVLSTRS